MIYNVIDYFQLYKLSRLIDSGEFKGIDFTAQTFFQYLIDNFDQDKIKVFVNVEKKEINGFAICSLSQDVVTRRPEVFIDLAWIKKGTDGRIGEDLLEKVEDYARSLKLSRISGFTLREQEGAMFKKYGFRRYSTIMVKDLKQVSSEPQNAQKEAKTSLQTEKKAHKKIAAATKSRSFKQRIRSHQRVCKEYYERNKEKIKQRQKERYIKKKYEESLNKSMNKRRE